MNRLTDNQLIRLWFRIRQRIRDVSKGDPYGVDLPTLNIIRPGLARAYREVKAEGERRGL